MFSLLPLGTALLAVPADAKPIDEFASRRDWACVYGLDDSTCGGPDTFAELATSRTVRLCGPESSAVECANVWRHNTKEDLLGIFMTFGKELESRLKRDKGWLRMPGPTPGVSISTMRTVTMVGSLEVGEGYVMAKLSDRPSCEERDLVDEMIPLLSVITERTPPDLWPEIKLAKRGTLMDAADHMGKVQAGEMPDKNAIMRWTLLTSEPFRCYMNQGKGMSVAEAQVQVVADYHAAVAPDAKEVRAQRKRAKELARIARRRGDVRTEDVTGLSDDARPEPEEEETYEDDIEINIDEILGEGEEDLLGDEDEEG